MSTFPSVPGIRVLRLLSEHAGVATHLVRIDIGDEARSACLVRATSTAAAPRVARLIGALDRLVGTGVTQLIDVTADEHGASAILENARGRRLSDVLAAREHWAAGEAVAVLAPLSRTIGVMHAAGVANGVWGASDVLLSARGPILDMTGDVEVFAVDAPEIVLAEVGAVASDRETMRLVTVEVLARVDGARKPAAQRLIADLATMPPAALIGLLTDALDELAAPVEVRGDDPPTPPEPTAVEHTRRHHEPRAGEFAVTTATATGVLAQFAGSPLVERVAHAAASTRALLDRMPRSRRVLVIGATAAVGMAAILIAVVPAPGVGDDELDSIRAQEAPIVAIGSSEPRSAGISDDPVVAVIELLELRETCFRELSVLCLEGVDQSGSTALAIDRDAIAAMRDGREGDWPRVAPQGAVVVERLGDSALVDVGPETAPASLLLMRSEAGWRIRDWVAVVPGS